MKLVVVAAFVVLNAVGFLAYRASDSPDAAASSLPTTSHEAADNLARDAGASQAKPAVPTRPAIAAQPAMTPSPSVPEHTNSPTDDATPPVHDTPVPRTRVKRPVARRGDETPAKREVVAKPTADDKPVETKAAAEPRPAESKPADKPKDDVLEMEANPYKRGE